ncbi:drosulfakinin isoform X2 [Leptinotarsa decemlineata]|uniref:drosulfakinin isoform X2 n=1 Tax=Leptinotarsa decemlineata TaxID=7539 RepID=UPI000C252999|nr:drosulfakinins isoform X2 [Leptinotarsa decemlineata]
MLLVTMVLRSLFTGFFIVSSLYLLLTYQFGLSLGAPGRGQNNHRSRNRGFGRHPISPQYAQMKNEPFVSDFIDADDFFEISKRQQNNPDDYGHMRFGRKGEEISDDYGHMRFGRSDIENK